MAVLQVRNLPDELHVALSQRAGELGVSMSEFVTRTLRAELSRPTVEAWVASVRDTDGPSGTVDVSGILDDVRVEYDAAAE